MKKAFDTVWHKALLVKLAKDRVLSQVIRFLCNWLLELKVRIGMEYSRVFKINLRYFDH